MCDIMIDRLCDDLKRLTIYDIKPYNTYSMCGASKYNTKKTNINTDPYIMCNMDGAYDDFTDTEDNAHIDTEDDTYDNTEDDTEDDTDDDTIYEKEPIRTKMRFDVQQTANTNLNYRYNIDKITYDIFVKKQIIQTSSIIYQHQPHHDSMSISSCASILQIYNSQINPSTPPTPTPSTHSSLPIKTTYIPLSNIYFTNKEFISTKLSINLLLVEKPDNYKHYNAYYSSMSFVDTNTDNDTNTKCNILCSCIGICIGKCIIDIVDIDADIVADIDNITISDSNSTLKLNAYLQYIKSHKLIINFSDNSQDAKHIYAKVLYIYQCVKMYYNSYDIVFPVNKVLHMPSELFEIINILIDNIKDIIIHNIIPNLEPYNIPTSTSTSTSTSTYRHNKHNKNNKNNIDNKNDIHIYDNEILYGLQLILCQIKLLINYYKSLHIYILSKMSNKDISSMFRLLHNMSTIIIYFNSNF